MKLFLCSHFSSVGSLIKEEIENKKVAFIPTASLREGYTGYVLVPHFFAWVRLIRKRKTIQMINKFLLVLLENRDSSSPFVICNCWLTDLQPEMVECKQQNCYI